MSVVSRMLRVASRTMAIIMPLAQPTNAQLLVILLPTVLLQQLTKLSRLIDAQNCNQGMREQLLRLFDFHTKRLVCVLGMRSATRKVFRADGRLA